MNYVFWLLLLDCVWHRKWSYCRAHMQAKKKIHDDYNWLSTSVPEHGHRRLDEDNAIDMNNCAIQRVDGIRVSTPTKQKQKIKSEFFFTSCMSVNNDFARPPVCNA